MGGRGASSGVSADGKKYGTEYRTLFEEGNNKFVVQNEKDTSNSKKVSVKSPKETMTKNRVYVTVNEKIDKPVYITYYDKDNKKYKSIDLEHPHAGMKPHVHHGYEHKENDGPKGATGLSPKEKRMVVLVNRLWYDYQQKRT